MTVELGRPAEVTALVCARPFVEGGLTFYQDFAAGGGLHDDITD